MRSFYRTALLLSGVLTLTGCFNKLNTTAIEQEIETEIESQSRRLSLSEVRCPRDVYRQAGAYFRCVGQLRPEGQFTINVTQKDSQGTIEWDVPNSGVILNVAKVENKIQDDFAKTFAKRAFIDCGEAYRINQPGERFECEVIGGVEIGQEAINSIFVRIDPDGNLNWYEVREPIAAVASAASDEAATEGTATATQGEIAPADADATTSETPREKIAGTADVPRPRVAGDDD